MTGARLAIVAALAVIMTLAPTGCARPHTFDDVNRIAEIRDACNEAGGTFHHWRADLGDRWYCNFDQREG
jgi:hypothetical protein